MTNKALNVQLNTVRPELSRVRSLGEGIIPCSTVTVEFDPSAAGPNRTAMVTLRVPLAFVELVVLSASPGSS